MKKIVASLIVMLLAGCAVGQRIDYTRVTPEIVNVPKGNIAVGAQDRRQYILSGESSEQYVGMIRGGFGNPFDVKTASGNPFAKDVTEVISRAMKHDGTKVVELAITPKTSRKELIQMIKSAKVDKAFVLTINEWETDTMMHISLSYDLVLEEFDGAGYLLRSSRSKGTDELGSVAFSLDPTAVLAKVAADDLKKRIEEMYSNLTVQTESKQDVYDELVKLDGLRKKGILTDKEFEEQKKKLLNEK